MRILVTGGAGFIGSHYVRMLLLGEYPGWEQAEVTVLDASKSLPAVSALEPAEALSVTRG